MSLNRENHTDYVLVSDANDVTRFAVHDPDITFSNHLPIFTVLTFSYGADAVTNIRLSNRPCSLMLLQLCWDKANRDSYYQHMVSLAAISRISIAVCLCGCGIKYASQRSQHPSNINKIVVVRC